MLQFMESNKLLNVSTIPKQIDDCATRSRHCMKFSCFVSLNLKHWKMFGSKKNNWKFIKKFRVKIVLLLLLTILIIYILSPRKPFTVKEYSAQTATKKPPIVVEILGGNSIQYFQSISFQFTFCVCVKDWAISYSNMLQHFP